MIFQCILNRLKFRDINSSYPARKQLVRRTASTTSIVVMMYYDTLILLPPLSRQSFLWILIFCFTSDYICRQFIGPVKGFKPVTGRISCIMLVNKYLNNKCLCTDGG